MAMWNAPPFVDTIICQVHIADALTYLTLKRQAGHCGKHMFCYNVHCWIQKMQKLIGKQKTFPFHTNFGG